MYKYLEVVNSGTEKKPENVAKRFNVTGKSKARIEEIYAEKTGKLPKTKFGRIINSDEELEAKEIKDPKPKKK